MLLAVKSIQFFVLNNILATIQQLLQISFGRNYL